MNLTFLILFLMKIEVTAETIEHILAPLDQICVKSPSTQDSERFIPISEEPEHVEILLILPRA